MADIKEIAKDVGLTVALGPLGPTVLALKKALKKHKEAKDKKEKAKFKKIIDDLKSEIKLSKGSHPGIETQPKRKAYSNVIKGNIRKYGKPVPLRPSKEKHPLEKRKPFGGAKFKRMKKGGNIKTYAKGSKVRKPKY